MILISHQIFKSNTLLTIWEIDSWFMLDNVIGLQIPITILQILNIFTARPNHYIDVNFPGRIAWYRLQRFGWRHFRWRKISQGRRHKDYLDKSKIGSTRNPGRNSHPNFIKCQKFSLLKINTNTYNVSEQKDKNRHEPSKQFEPKLQ